MRGGLFCECADGVAAGSLSAEASGVAEGVGTVLLAGVGVGAWLDEDCQLLLLKVST